MSGLEPPILQYTQTFDVHHNHEFIQVLNLANNHWITVSTVGCVPGVVNVKRTIANLLHTNKSTIVVQQARMQLQSGGSDCGLFAIATATAICNGQNPENIQFNQHLLRQHLLKCLKEKLLLPFQSTKAPKRRPGVASRERIHVYCTCRLPDDGRKMIQCTSCKMWYHCNCMKLSQRMMKNIPWYCGTPCHAK